jgi:hypothetical protein
VPQWQVRCQREQQQQLRIARGALHRNRDSRLPRMPGDDRARVLSDLHRVPGEHDLFVSDVLLLRRRRVRERSLHRELAQQQLRIARGALHGFGRR